MLTTDQKPNSIDKIQTSCDVTVSSACTQMPCSLVNKWRQGRLLGNQYFMGWVCGFEEFFDLQFTFRYNKDPSP